MKRTFYDVLQVNNSASHEVIDATYQMLIKKLESDFSQDALNNKMFIQTAYETLSNPAKRELYDKSFKQQKYETEYQSELVESFSEVWWKSSKFTLLMLAVIGLIGFSLFTKHTGENNKVAIVEKIEATKRQEIQLGSENVSKHLDNEAILVNGTVVNQSKYIDESAKVANRIVDVAQQDQERQRVDLEYRANAGSQILDMQRKQQEANIEFMRQQQLNYENQINRERVEKQNRYNYCFVDALDKYAAYSDARGKATEACKNYR